MNQINSRERVRDHGEVYTSEREVNAMLDLVKNETERIDSRFLEPACGNGNFLISILQRKLEVVKKRYIVHQVDFELNSLLAISSIYGIDILEDNVNATKNRLLCYFSELYKQCFKEKINQSVINSANFILSKNIILGDALAVNSVIFTSWSLIGQQFKREEYKLEELHQDEPDSLFGFHNEVNDDPADALFSPIKAFPLTYYTELTESCNDQRDI